MNIGIVVRTVKDVNDIFCIDYLKDGEKTHGVGGFTSARDAFLCAAGDMKALAGEYGEM